MSPSRILIFSLGIYFLTVYRGLAVDGSDGLPCQVIEAELGDANAELQVQLVQVPLFLGDRLTVRVTVRNRSGSPRKMLRPDGMFLQTAIGTTKVRDQLSRTTHDCVPLTLIPGTHADTCVHLLQRKEVIYQVDDVQRLIFTSEVRSEPDRKFPELEYAWRLSSHDLLPDRWLRLAVRHPGFGTRRWVLPRSEETYTFCIVARDACDRFWVVGIEHPEERLLRFPDDRTSPEDLYTVLAYNLIRYQTVSSADLDIRLAPDGELLVNGSRPAHPTRPMPMGLRGWFQEHELAEYGLPGAGPRGGPADKEGESK